MDNTESWSLDRCKNKQYRHKLVDVVQVLADWFEPFGGFDGKDVLEFGCGEGTVALGVALQRSPRRIVGVEIQGVYEQCLPSARENLGLASLPTNLELVRIAPGDNVSALGVFDCIYSWSVFEHVHQALLLDLFRDLKKALAPGGSMFLQIAPLFYSRDGSHLAPWVPVPWGHLAMQTDAYYDQLMSAPETCAELRSNLHIAADALRVDERNMLWRTYVTLNKVTAPQLERLVRQAGLEIVRDYRTSNDNPIPESLAEIFDEQVLRTEQIVWMMQHARG